MSTTTSTIAPADTYRSLLASLVEHGHCDESALLEACEALGKRQHMLNEDLKLMAKRKRAADRRASNAKAIADLKEFRESHQIDPQKNYVETYREKQRTISQLLDLSRDDGPFLTSTVDPVIRLELNSISRRLEQLERSNTFQSAEQDASLRTEAVVGGQIVGRVQTLEDLKGEYAAYSARLQSIQGSSGQIDADAQARCNRLQSRIVGIEAATKKLNENYHEMCRLERRKEQLQKLIHDWRSIPV